jgi:hypothetical protein
VKHGKKNVTCVSENRAVLEDKRYKECSRAEQQIRESAKGRTTTSSKMIEAILDIKNITHALKQVSSNKGASGVDGMQTDELGDFTSGFL